MNRHALAQATTPVELELFQPSPDVYYGLDATASIAGVSRRTILRWCRAGLLHPVFLPPYGVMAFTSDAVVAARRVENMRAAHDLDTTLLGAVAALLVEVDRLRSEVRFLRGYAPEARPDTASGRFDASRGPS